MAVGIDTDPSEKQQLQLTVQIVLPQNVANTSKGSSAGVPVMTLTETGDTLFEAIRKMTSKTSRRLFFSHTQLLVIGEQMARKGIYPLMDLIERNSDIRTDIAVLVTRGTTAKDILQVSTQMESIPANQMNDAISVNQIAYGMIYKVVVHDITRMASDGKKEVALPSISIDGSKSAGNTSDNIDRIQAQATPDFRTMAVFRDGKLVQYLKMNESRGLSFIHNKVTSSVIKLACPDSKGFMTVELKGSKTETKAKKKSAEMPLIQIEISPTGSINEIMCPGINVVEEKTMQQIEELVNEVVRGEVNAAITKLQKQLHTDALGWAGIVYKQQPQMWKRIERDWDSLFPEIPYEIFCRTEIKDAGIRVDSIVK